MVPVAAMVALTFWLLVTELQLFALTLFAVRIYLTIPAGLSSSSASVSKTFPTPPQGEYGERITETKVRESSQRKIIA